MLTSNSRVAMRHGQVPSMTAVYLGHLRFACSTKTVCTCHWLMQKESKHELYQFPCGILECSVEQENLCSTQYGFNPVRQVILTTLLKICCLGCKASKQTKFYWRCCGFYCVLCDFGVIVQVTYFSSIYINLSPIQWKLLHSY